MKKLSNNEQGFSALELILIVITVGLLGFAGWYVWRSHNDTNNTSVSKPAATKTTATTIDPTSSWKTYSSETGKYTLKYPASWTLNDCDGYALLGATSAEAGHCNSGSAAQIQISSTTDDERQNWQLKYGAAYPDVKTSTVTINGVEATKQTATSSPGSNNTGIGFPDGTRVTQYIFYINGRTYLFAYCQDPTGTDISTDANLIVTKTLKFN